MKSIFLIATLLVLACSAEEMKSQWEDFKVKHDKSYASAEIEEYRYQLWLETDKYIHQHNKRYDAGEVTYYLGHNKVSDMTIEEKKRILGKGLDTKRGLKTKPGLVFEATRKSLPKSADWRQKGAVTPIKDQGQCGSCWAFSAIASIEGQYFLKTKTLASFSEQQLVDCVTEANGCEGGLMDLAFEYLETRSLETEAVYPYVAKDSTCAYDDSKSLLIGVDNYTDVKSGDEMALQQAIIDIGPISVAIDASSNDFQQYAGGIYAPHHCRNDRGSLDHGVTAVGYGVNDEDEEYYIVKNSWGADWGEKGYIRMPRNKDNMCGIATLASFPTL